MLAVLLMAAVVAGIAWPILKNRFGRGAVAATESTAEGTMGSATASAPRLKEELCPQCSRLNPPGRRLCVDCNGPMPVSDVNMLWQGANKDEAIREGVQSGILMLGMVIAMALANFLPIAGKLLILFATIGVLGYRFLRVIAD